MKRYPIKIISVKKFVRFDDIEADSMEEAFFKAENLNIIWHISEGDEMNKVIIPADEESGLICIHESELLDK